MCREIQMGVAVAQLAMHDAGLKSGGYDVDRTGVVYGSDYIMTAPEEFTEGVRSCLTADEQFDFTRWATDGMPKVTPLVAAQVLAEHAGQSRGDLQRFARPEQLDYAARSVRRNWPSARPTARSFAVTRTS